MPTPASPNPAKEALYQQLARIGKAVSSPQRLALLDLLSNGDKREARGTARPLPAPLHHRHRCSSSRCL